MDKTRVCRKAVFLFDLYDIFQKNDLFFLHDFYDVYQCEYYSFMEGKPSHDMADFDMNHIFFRHRREFEEEKDDEIKRKKLEVLIFDLVFAKDFLLLKEYIDIYVNEYDSEFSKEYIDFYHVVENLLHDIKIKLRAREQKDCIMVWLDALEYGEDKTLSFFIRYMRIVYLLKKYLLLHLIQEQHLKHYLQNQEQWKKIHIR